ncbi:MAG: site-specific integrase [Hyphomicrobiales bacterium]|nr:site-specific integrase [Hyphomicrobiales bacterium]
MAAIVKLPSGSWRAQVRRKGKYVTATFLRRKDADEWALATERNIDRGVLPNSPDPKSVRTLTSIIELHIRDHVEVGKPIRRSKANVLEALKISLGDTRIHDLKRSKLIEYGKRRAKEGAGPATLSIDISFLATLLTHAAAVHGIEVYPEEVKLARVALSRLGLVGKGTERDRRPSEDELTKLIVYFNHKPRQLIPMARIIRFAVATAMRQEEICKFDWTDVDIQKRLVTVRDRKDPRKKDGNNQRVPMLNLTGYDAWEVLLEQRIITGGIGRVFAHHHKSVGTAFRRACRELKIHDLHFHDLRHEATSRLFEAGLTIERVALVTGHKDWKMLRRYTNLRPESLHAKGNVVGFQKTSLVPEILKEMTTKEKSA